MRLEEQRAELPRLQERREERQQQQEERQRELRFVPERAGLSEEESCSESGYWSLVLRSRAPRPLLPRPRQEEAGV